MTMIKCVHSVTIDCARYMCNASFSYTFSPFTPNRRQNINPISWWISSIFHSSILLFFSRQKENKLTYVLEQDILLITRDGTLRVVFHNLRHCHVIFLLPRSFGCHANFIKKSFFDFKKIFLWISSESRRSQNTVAWERKVFFYCILKRDFASHIKSTY